MDLGTITVKHAIVFIGMLQTVTGIYSSFAQNGKNKVNFFVFGLHFEHRLDTINGKGKLLIEFLYV